jgi:hypothetical protein
VRFRRLSAGSAAQPDCIGMRSHLSNACQGFVICLPCEGRAEVPFFRSPSEIPWFLGSIKPVVLCVLAVANIRELVFSRHTDKPWCLLDSLPFALPNLIHIRPFPWLSS